MAADEITRVAAYGLIVNKGRIILCRISEEVPSNVGEWTLPGGGIKFGEDPEAAVVREVFEETGLHVKVDDLVSVTSTNVEQPDRVVHAIRVLYRLTVLGGELTFEVGGTTDLCAWLTPDEARVLPLIGLARLGLELAFPS